MGGMLFVTMSALLSLLSYCAFMTLICLHPCFCETSHILHLGWNDLMHWQMWVVLVFYLLLRLFLEHKHIPPQKPTTSQSLCKTLLT